MKSKYVAGILAIFFGIIGLHKFYLNKVTTGLIRIILLFLFFYLGIFIGIKILWFISLIEGFKFLTMSEENFNNKYNDEQSLFDNKRPWGSKNIGTRSIAKDNPYKKVGIEKYKEYDYQGAIENFNKALVIEPYDNATHFNLACCYSLNEETEKAFYHLNKAIEYGYKDFERLKTHEGLAYIRTLPEYEEWINKIILSVYPNDLNPTGKDLDLLEQIRILNEKKEKGELDDEMFINERKRLMR